MFLQPGTLIDGKFEVIRTIGSGGMGIVYDALQSSMQRTVAIKVLTYAASEVEEDLKRFEREAKALSRLSHPGIVQFVSYGFWQGCPYVAMERLQGRSLQHLLSTKEAGIEPRLALDIAIQICDALSHAHAVGVLHRDIKPSNIILVEDNEHLRVKLIDFGLAKLTGLDGEQKLTRTNQALGSVMYMSPEQCQGQPAGPTSDIYGLGCVLHECLIGEPPFAADNGVAVMFQHVNAALNECSGWNRLGTETRQVIEKCLAKQPKDRFENAEALKKQLQSLLDGDDNHLVVAAPEIQAAPAKDQFAGRRKTLIAASVALIMVALSFVLFQAIQQSQTRETSADSEATAPTEGTPQDRLTSPQIALDYGLSYKDAGKWHDSVSALTKADQLATGDSAHVPVRLRFKIKVNLGKMLTLTQDGEKAHAVYTEALILARQLTKQDELDALNQAGANSFQQGKTQEALDYALQSIEISKELLKGNPTAVVIYESSEAWELAAQCYAKLDKWTEELQARRNAIDATRRNQDTVRLSHLLVHLAVACQRSNHPADARKVLNELNPVWEAVKDQNDPNTWSDLSAVKDEMGAVKMNLGDYQGAQGDFSLAVEYAEKQYAAASTGAMSQRWKKFMPSHFALTLGQACKDQALCFYKRRQMDAGDRSWARAKEVLSQAKLDKVLTSYESAVQSVRQAESNAGGGRQ